MTHLKVVCLALIIVICLPPSFELNNGGRIPYTKSRLILEYNWPKVIKGMKRIPHVVSCDHFYATRPDGRHDIKKCPNGQSFDFRSLLCEEKTQAHCWSKQFMPPDDSKMNQFVCPFPWGLYPDVEKCSKYFSCLNGKATKKKCPNLLMFDKVSRKCVNESEAMCANEKDIVEPGYKCPYTWGFFTYSKDCSKYYECLQKNPSLRTCKRNMLFDNLKRKCLQMSRVDCGDRYNPYEQAKSSSIKSDLTTILQSSTSYDSLSISRQSSENGENATERISSQRDDYVTVQTATDSTQKEDNSTASSRDEYSTGKTSTDVHSTENKNPTASRKDEYSLHQTANLPSTQNEENPTVRHKDEYSTGKTATDLYSAQNEENLTVSNKDEYSARQTAHLHSTQNEGNPIVSHKDGYSTQQSATYLHSTQNEDNSTVRQMDEYSARQTAHFHSTQNENSNIPHKDEYSTRQTEIDLHPTQSESNPIVSHKDEYTIGQIATDLL